MNHNHIHPAALAFDDAPAEPPSAELNPEQAEALRLLSAGRNVFLSGVAGTGKTFALNAWLASNPDLNVAVTASTGIAATHLNGRTVHSWSGCGIGDRPAKQIVNTYFWQNVVKPEIVAADALVIDEVSMLDGLTFEMVSDLCRFARHKREVSFGGLQVILVGDMGQLAPVDEADAGFAFETTTWWDLGLEHVELHRVMRQRDAEFVRALQELRAGALSERAFRLFEGRVRAYDPTETDACRLMTHNAQVERVNEDRLRRLGAEIHTFTAHESGLSPKFIDHLDRTCLSPRELRIAVGARVMMTKNNAPLWANGSMGYVTRIERNEDGAPRIFVQLDSLDEPIQVERAEWVNYGTDNKGRRTTLARRIQYPLRLAWAITVHKSQGMTIDRVSVDLSGVFAPGQAYVALSRARSLEGLNIEAWRGHESIIAHPTVMAFVRGEYTLPPE